MKTTLMATFAIAVKVFVFNATPSYANEESNRKVRDFFTGKGTNFDGFSIEGSLVADPNRPLRDPAER